MYQQQVILEFVLVLSSVSFLQSAFCRTNNGQAIWTPSEDSWNYWWSYSGVSGPTYWGLLNLDWFVCDKGRRQSPIDIETRSLVYDPHLRPLRADNNLISGVLYNDGHAIVFSGSMSRSLMNMKPNLEQQTNRQSRQNGTISKRHIANDGQIFSQSAIETTDYPPKYSSDTSSVLLGDLNNSVDLSKSQSDKLDFTDSVLEKQVTGNSDTGDNLDNFDDAIVSGAANEQKQIEDEQSRKVQFTGAGLIYPYTFEALYIRFSLDTKSAGSEHLINSHAYAAELQLFAYNSLLYKNYLEALTKPHGLLAISILIDVQSQNYSSENESKRSSLTTINGPFESLLQRLGEIKHRGDSALVRGFNLSAILPETDYFVTYEGSLTTPACLENVNWLVLNRPLYITQSNLDSLRSISADEQSSTQTGTLIAGNIRPVQPVNNRPIRTNIRPFSGSNKNPETCQRLWTKYEYKPVRERTEYKDSN